MSENNSTEPKLTELKPYLIRAMLEWLWDNSVDPSIRLDGTHPQVDVPTHLQKNGLVLKLSGNAIQQYHADNDGISFSANFNQAHYNVYIPVEAIQCVFAPSAGSVGMMFEPESPQANTERSNATAETSTPTSKPTAASSPKTKPSFLKVVK